MLFILAYNMSSYECEFSDCRKLFLDKGSYRKHLLTHGEKQVSGTLMVLFSIYADMSAAIKNF
jgi:hypothetical protein